MRYAFAILLLAASPAAAQGSEDLSLETRLLLAGLDAAEGAAGVYEQALDHADSATVDAEGIRFLRQRGMEGALGAANGQALLQVYTTLRAEQSANAEPPLTDEEFEVLMLLTELQTFGGDLVKLDACQLEEEPFNVAAARERATPTLSRVQELVDLLRSRVEGEERSRSEEQP